MGYRTALDLSGSHEAQLRSGAIVGRCKIVYAFGSSPEIERRRWDDATWAAAWAAGRALTWEQAADEALAWLAHAQESA